MREREGCYDVTNFLALLRFASLYCWYYDWSFHGGDAGFVQRVEGICMAWRLGV
jgi:hypothetical protein